MILASKRALVLVFDGVEEVEVVTPIDLLRRAGVHVTVAAVGSQLEVTGRNGIRLGADCLLADVKDDDLYDAFVIPGGPGVAEVRKVTRVGMLAKRHAEAGAFVAAICAAPTLLNDVQLLDERRHTAHFSVKSELPNLDETVPVIRDHNIITSRGAGTAVHFALELITALVSEEAAHEVARSICWTN